MLWLGVGTLALAADDHFLLHEIVVPWIMEVTENVTFGLYALVVATLLWRGREALLARAEVSILGLALVAFTASVGLDLGGADVPGRREGEETLKMFGTVAWGAFPATIVVRTLRGDARNAGRS